jgi:hypothetical protein
MGKKFVITESEKNQILKMYGLMKESQEEELLKYLDAYLAAKDCEDIAKDLETFKGSEAYGKLSEEEQKELDNAIFGLKNPGTATIKIKFEQNHPCKNLQGCDCVKAYMRQKIADELKTNKEKVISQVCSMAKNNPIPNLPPVTFCDGNSTGDKGGVENKTKTDDKGGVENKTKTDDKGGVENKTKTDDKGGVENKTKTDDKTITQDKQDGGQTSTDTYIQNRQKMFSNKRSDWY